MQRAETNNYYPHLMASKLAVDGNTIATTSLDWINGANLATHTPLFSIVTYGSGDLSVCQITILADVLQLADSILLTVLDATYTKAAVNLMSYIAAIKPDAADFMVASVDIPSTIASTFNIYVYGIRL